MAIYYDGKSRSFYLESKNLTYAFCVSEYGFLNHLYFGKRIGREDLNCSITTLDRGQNCVLPNATSRHHSLNFYANEWPTFGRSDYRESVFAFLDESGVRVGDFLYATHEIVSVKPSIEGMPSVKGGQTLIVTLKDERTKLSVLLYYTVFEDLPVILRRAEIKNDGEKSVTIDRAYSFSLDLPMDNWQALTLPGAHVRERFAQRNNLVQGVFAVDSKRGISSAQMNPFMGILRENTDENQGEVYGFNLVYSGDFVFKAQIEESGTLRVLGGINDYDFSWELASGKTFATPECVMVYSNGGLGDLSRTYHDLYRNYLINPRFVNQTRPIVINNWEATYFNFDYKKIKDIIQSVSGTGIDTFVLDDGWFGKRNNDLSSLGDWFVFAEKLPEGLKPIIDFTHEKGMKFGLWFEPEMVSPDSDLYRAHPEWAIGVEGMQSCYGRDQLVLDLSQDEVCDYVIKVISDILNNNEIDYVKWDMNRCLTENYSYKLGKNSKELHHRYVLGLYKICEALVNGFPHIFFEGCASGGARFDPAMLYYFPQIWTSDDTDAYMRSIIQYGTSICYPLSSQSCHVSESPNHQCGRASALKSRGDMAHLGATGYELDTTKLGEAELKEIAKQVDEYKQMQDLVLFGDLYRLNNPLEQNLFAEIIVSKDKSKAHLTVMQAVALPNGQIHRVYPKGLDEDTNYHIPELNVTLSGKTIMNVGINICIPRNDFVTQTYNFKSVK